MVKASFSRRWLRSPASRDITRKGKVLPEHQKFAYSLGVAAKSFKFLRKRPHARACGQNSYALPAEKSLKNDGGAREVKGKKREGKKIRGKGIIQFANRPKVSRLGWSPTRNYPQTIVKLSLLLTLFWVPRTVYIRCAENLAEVSPFANACSYSRTKKFPFW